RRTGREYRHVGAALADEPELVRFDALAYFVVADRQRLRQLVARFVRGQQRLPVSLMRRRRRRVVSVAVYDHPACFPSIGLSERRPSMASSMLASSPLPAACDHRAACAWLRAQASLIQPLIPDSATVRAASRISSARRAPCSS